jgi:TolB-like protein/tetratricopeptide (TPR) repeat protein
MTEDANRADPKPPHLDRLSALWRRLNDHKIVQWSVAYVALAYGIQHAVILTSESFEWPNTVARVAMLVLALGLPLVVTFAWYHGARASRNFSQAELSILAALLVMSSLFFYVFVRSAGEAPAPAAQQASVTAALAAAASPKGAISLAVLPFVNLSGDATQEFFSDGMTEEITSALAKVPDLRVVARTSAYQFRAQNRDIQSIGQQLHATHFIEGSVRKAGDQVRITVQLIKADDGTHIWAEDYNRQLTDIFAIQEDIARAITASLRMPLGLKPGETLVHGTQNLGTYQEFLQAKAWLRDRGSPRSGPFLQTLESVVARDPGFAPAWAVLSRAYAYQITASPAVPEGPVGEARRVVQSFREKAEMAARKAIQLDPQHSGGYWAMANIRWFGGEWATAEDLVKQALALDPNDPDVLSNYWNILLKTGRPKEALVVAERLRTLEPLVPAYQTNAAMSMQVTGQNEAAIAVFEAIPANVRSRIGYTYLARAYAAAGRYTEAADTLLQLASLYTSPRVKKGLQDAAAVLRRAPAKAADQKALPEFGPPAGDLIFVYAAVGAFDRVMDYPEREAQIHYMPDSGKTLWTPVMAPVRKTERFKAFARNTGLVEYWRAKGWPDLCHPTIGADFECN